MENRVFEIGQRLVSRVVGCRPRPAPARRRALGLVFAGAFCVAQVAGCSGGGGGDSDAAVDNVSLFTAAAVITALTGASEVRPTSINPTADGLFLMVDGASGAVLLFDQLGRVAVFTSGQELENVVGQAVEMGRLDQILLGALAGQLIGVDELTGLLIRLDTDGTPVVHATEAQITAFTGRASARMSLPRFLLPNAIMAQELVTGDILQIGNTGAAIALFVSAARLAIEAGVLPQEAVVVEWARGGGTRSFFARFASTSNIVKIEENGTTSRHVDGTSLVALFPDVTNLRVLGIVADVASDALLLLIGDGARGVALAAVAGFPPFTAEVFASAEEFAAVLGDDYDLAAIGTLQSGVAYAIDRGSAQVATFGAGGQPLLLATTESIRRESGTETPEISSAVRLDSVAVIVVEETTGNLLRTQ